MSAEFRGPVWGAPVAAAIRAEIDRQVSEEFNCESTCYSLDTQKLARAALGDLMERLEREAQELDRRAHATGQDREPAGWLRGWEAKGVRRAIDIARNIPSSTK